MMLITKYTSLLLQSSKKTAMVSPTYFRGDAASNSAAAFLPATEPDEEDEEICCFRQRDSGSGDAFLEPYMQGLAGDFGNAAFTREVFEEEVSITTTSVTAGEDHRSSRIPSSDLFPRPSHEKNDTVRTSGRRSGSRRRLETPASAATYDPDENIEDQIVPLLSSPIGVDLPETPTADSVDSVHNRFKLVQVNTRERVAGTTGGSQASLSQLTSGDECSTGSSDTTNSSLEEEETPCNITLLERLIRTHPIWFLPGIQRAGAFHLLQGKEDGNFVVRQSSQNSTMAISVRLPNGKGPYIEHYLIQGTADGQIGLESSDNKFSSIPLLIAHYCQCCDELPVQLTLPRAIREAKNRQQLSSLALLGQEFWRYPMANSRPSLKGNEDPSAVITVISPSKEDISVNSDSIPSSSSNSPASSLSSFDSATGGNNVVSSGSMTGPSPVLELENCSSLPISESSVQPSSLMTTFKGSPPFGNKTPHNQIGIPVSSECLTSLPVEASHNSTVLSTTSCFGVRKPRPTPPNTLNLISDVSTSPTSTAAPALWCSNNNSNFAVASSATSATTPPTNKTPPPPPPRWAKPVVVGTAVSSNVNSGGNVGTPSNNTTVVGQQNFTVTTTLTFSVNNKESSPPPQVQVSCIQISSPIPEKEESRSVSITQIQNTSVGSSAPLSLTQIPQTTQITPSSATSPLIQSSNSSQVLSPVSEGNTRPFHKKNRRHRVSRHYQRSDILESSVTYHRSTVADKVSDYEDIWGPDSSLSTFKPHASTPKTPFTPLEEFPAKSLKTDLPSTDVSEQRMSSSSAVTSPSESSAVNRNRFGLVIDAINSTPISVANTADLKSPTESVKSPVELKQPSPFYAEPADAIKHQNALLRKKPRSSPTGQQTSNNRHSDPTLLHQWPQLTSGCNSNLERIDSKEELITHSGLSSSMDNLISFRNSRRFISGPLNLLVKSPKPVEPPKIAPIKKQHTDSIWPVDPSWEFVVNNLRCKDVDDLQLGFDAESVCRISSPQSENKPVILSCQNSFSRRGLTVQERISERLPKLVLSPVYIKINNISSSTNENNESAEKMFLEPNCRLSISENIFEFPEKSCHNGLSVLSQFSDNSDDAQTEFSEPWDSSNWEHLLPKFENSEPSPNTSARVSSSKSFKERLDPLLSPPRLKALARVRAAAGTGSSPGASVRAYALQLAADKSTVFAQSIDNFIACTIDSKETRPQVVMRNIRQFMSGMKNYLLKHGEGEFEKEVEKERSKLKANEFMNLDAILEGVMHKLILLPLKDHLYNLFVDHYTENGAIQQLADSISLARTTPAQDLGLRDKIIPPKQSDLLKIFECFNNLQIADSPLEKLEHLLSAIAAIFHSVKVLNKGSEVTFLGADDFLPLFVWVLVQSGMVAAEIEAEYMWGLLHPSLLSGEGGYYLTTLSSAVNVLKNFKECSNGDQNPTISWCNDSLNEFRSVLKVVVPDEMNGSLLTKTLPVRPNMTTRDICKIIALKLRITNPQDYSLFKLVDGEETLLSELDSPQDIKGAVTAAGKHCIFAYKRIDAKIAWPTSPTQE